VAEAAKHGGPLPVSVSAVLPLCRNLVQMPELRWRHRGADEQIGQIAVHYVPAITRNVASAMARGSDTAAASSHDMSPVNVFRRFEDRLSAGEALERAKQLEREGRTAEAKDIFEYAFERAPDDFDLLSAFGDFRMRQGDPSGAADLFRNAITSEPDNRASHSSLAIALYRSSRQREALDVLKTALAKWPDFHEARELIARMSYGSQQP
jgi:tetratricopeptide (TPR) repeat protein